MVDSCKLVGLGYTGPSPNQGRSVSLSSDGNTLAIGGPSDNINIGAAWIYTRTGGTTWNQQGPKLVGTGYTGTVPRQGYSVSLSSSGNTLAVGGPSDNGYIGATWIFDRTRGTTWSENGQGKLVGTGYTGLFCYQGFSVSLSSDGNTLAIGGYGDNIYAGATWIYTRTGGTNWNQQGDKLIGSGQTGTSPAHGFSVSLSSDGNILANGGVGDNSDIGATWIYTRTGGTTWNQQGPKLVGTGYTGTSAQGTSVSLSSNGNTLAVGGVMMIIITSVQLGFTHNQHQHQHQYQHLYYNQSG